MLHTEKRRHRRKKNHRTYYERFGVHSRRWYAKRHVMPPANVSLRWSQVRLKRQLARDSRRVQSAKSMYLRDHDAAEDLARVSVMRQDVEALRRIELLQKKSVTVY